jgi:hypothetical protein
LVEKGDVKPTLTLTERIRRTQGIVAIVCIVAGLIGFNRAGSVTFTADRGALVAWPRYELYLMTYNRLGALVVVALGLVGLAAVLTRRQMFASIAAGGFALLALQVLVQWRPEGTNWFGAAGANMSFALAAALGFAATAALTGPAAQIDTQTLVPR